MEPRQALEIGVWGSYTFVTRVGLRSGSAAVASANADAGSAALCFSCMPRSENRVRENSAGQELLRSSLPRTRTLAVRCKWRDVGRFIRAEVRAQVIDQSVAIGGIDQRTPFRHLVYFFCPCGFAQSLLHDDASLVAFRTRRRRLRLHNARRKLGRRAGRGSFLPQRSTRQRNREH